VSGTFLAGILEAKRARLARGDVAPPGTPALPSDGERFVEALRNGPAVIAEIKQRSPSAGLLLPDAPRRIEEVARAYRRGGAAALSVVVEQDHFGGEPSWIPRAKSAAGLPVLMKDFVLDEVQLDLARSLGADAVLLIVAALSDAELARLRRAAHERGLAVLVEAHDAEEVRRALAVSPEAVGVNARDLRTFSVDLAAVESAGREIPSGVLRVAESGVKTAGDVTRLGRAGFGAVLVGETLLRSGDGAKAIRYLLGRGTTEVKVCGLMREEDVESCLALGVDWIGLVFSPRSPRRLTIERGRALAERARGASGAKGVVAVFAENTSEEIRAVSGFIRPDAVQLCDPPGTAEPPAGPAVWQTVAVGRDPLDEALSWPGDALHFDSAVAGRSGGTGAAFDWSLILRLRVRRPFVLAGGLDATNVRAAIRAAHPFAVDVATGVETSPGIKDPAKLAAFVEEVRRG
jgi:indole-3-glycerol phosphate synthase/phosphoribosylanthranilate isomerase